MSLLSTLAVCLIVSVDAFGLSFPEDDPDCMHVIDRAYYKDFSGENETILYLTMLNIDGQGTLFISRYSPGSPEDSWEHVYTWEPVLDPGMNFIFQPVSVITLQDNGSTLLISWIDRVLVEYCEGIATNYLEYDFQNETFNELWSD